MKNFCLVFLMAVVFVLAGAPTVLADDFRPLFGAQAISGGGWMSEVTLKNPTSETHFGRLVFLTNKGEAWPINGSPDIYFRLKPQEEVSFRLGNYLGPLQTGWVSVYEINGVFRATPLVVGTIARLHYYSGVVFRTPLVPASETVSISGATPWTGVAIVNSTAFSAHDYAEKTVKLLLFNSNLFKVGETTVTLPAFAQTAKFVGEFFPGLPANFAGRVVVMCNDGNVAVTSINF